MGKRKRAVSYGQCFFCNRSLSKGGMSRHLKSCPERKKAIATEKGPKEHLFHIRVEDLYSPYYWMHLEISGQRTLSDLDGFLRAVWLECCGHLSQFIIGNTYYVRRHLFDWFGDEGDLDELEEEGVEGVEEEEDGLAEIADALNVDRESVKEQFESLRALFRLPEERDMGVSLNEALQVGLTLAHEYDFGTTTELRLRVVDEREGEPPSDDEARIMARNYAPRLSCEECGALARWLYAWDYPMPAFCDQHARAHPEWEDGFLPIVNSPRAGLCGYTGPFQKKYRFEVFAPEEE